MNPWNKKNFVIPSEYNERGTTSRFWKYKRTKIVTVATQAFLPSESNLFYGSSRKLRLLRMTLVFKFIITIKRTLSFRAQRGNPLNKLRYGCSRQPFGLPWHDAEVLGGFILKYMKKLLLLSLLIINPSFAEMTCDTNVSKYYAVYTKNSYTCASGQFLPANAVACVSCPTGFTCNGGTFDFNPDYFQGLSFFSVPTTQMNNVCAVNFPKKLHAKYAPNSHNCSSGYYLPANVDECAQCPSGSACVGGTYAFNETTDQGIIACAGGTFAPSGSAVCYPHILHVGNDNVYLKSEKTTTPSLNIRLVNDIFYANMSPTRVQMNKDTEHYFRVRWENNDYYICDDTTCPNGE